MSRTRRDISWVDPQRLYSPFSKPVYQAYYFLGWYAEKPRKMVRKIYNKHLRLLNKNLISQGFDPVVRTSKYRNDFW